MSNDVTNDEGRTGGTHERIESAKSRFEEGTRSAVSGAKNKFGTAADRVESGLSRAAEASARGAHKATDKAGEWRDRSTEFAHHTRDRADDALDSMREFVREKPVQSVAIALAAGWVIGRLMHSRR